MSDDAGMCCIADREGWVASITPSGGWIPAVIAGTTGIGLSQRIAAQAFDVVPHRVN
jgi:gamma-glutamyltranspeptidase/glutathione hydrolase